MPMMKSPYAHQIISLSGHSVEFEANKPVWVAENEMLIEECLAKGATRLGDEPPEVVAPEEKSDNGGNAGALFAIGLDQALIRILTRNDPADLTADLMPKVLRVTAEMSPDLRRPTATEISEAYERLQENIDLAE